MIEFWQNIFYTLVAEIFVILTAWLVKEDKRRQLLVLAFGSIIAGVIGFSPLIFRGLSPSLTSTSSSGTSVTLTEESTNKPIFILETPSEGNSHSQNTPLSLGEVIFEENFDNNNNSWPTGINKNNYEVYLDTGEYHIIGEPNGKGMWFGVSKITNIGDFYLETKSRRIEDSLQSNDYGVLFRQSNLINYVFVINPDQQSYALLRVDMLTDQYTELIHWVYSPKISTGFESNVIGILGVGDSITIFINGNRIDSIQDNSSLSGAIGFVGGAGEHVAIEYLKIWSLK